VSTRRKKPSPHPAAAAAPAPAADPTLAPKRRQGARRSASVAEPAGNNFIVQRMDPMKRHLSTCVVALLLVTGGDAGPCRGPAPGRGFAARLPTWPARRWSRRGRARAPSASPETRRAATGVMPPPSPAVRMDHAATSRCCIGRATIAADLMATDGLAVSVRLERNDSKLNRVLSTSLRANGSRECAPDDRLAKQSRATKKSRIGFVARAPRNDGRGRRFNLKSRHMARAAANSIAAESR